jgi:hypothetical protein
MNQKEVHDKCSNTSHHTRQQDQSHNNGVYQVKERKEEVKQTP